MELSTILIVALVLIVISGIRIIPEYDRAIVFRLGRALKEPRGPGLIYLIPIIDQIEARVSTRIIALDVSPQDVITLDNISLKVNAVVYFRVIDTMKAIINIENYLYATTQLAQTNLRSILGEHSLDQLLSHREAINDKLQQIMDHSTETWGIKVENVDIKHIDLPAEQQRAMARQAEAERERRAKIIAAEGELQAAATLKQAADQMAVNPVTVTLRYLQTLSDISAEQNSKIVVFPLPIDLLKIFTDKK